MAFLKSANKVSVRIMIIGKRLFSYLIFSTRNLKVMEEFLPSAHPKSEIIKGELIWLNL